MKKLILIFLLPFVGSLFGQVEDVRITADGTVINTKTVKFATGKLMVNGVAVVGGPAGVTSVSGTAPIVSSGGLTPAISITAATTGAPGSMSAADKTKLDGIAAGAQPGTVTSVAVSVANGIGITGSPITTSGTFALSLGAITPTSVAASGAVSGSNLSGTNTGDQTSIVGITGTLAQFNTALTGADFASGGGTATGTNTGDQDLSALALKATTISTTSPLTGGGDLSTNRTFAINDAGADGTTKGASTYTASDFNATAGLISLDYTNGQAASGSVKGFLTSADWTTFNNKGSGTVTNFSAGDLSPLFTTSEATTTTTPALSFTISNAAANTVFGNFTGGSAAPGFSDTPTFNGSNITALNATNVSSGTLADARLSGNVSLLGSAIDLSGAEATGVLAAARFPALTGDVTTSAGAIATTVAANAVTNAKAAQMAANTVKGNNTGSTANAADLTVAQIKTMLGMEIRARVFNSANISIPDSTVTALTFDSETSDTDTIHSTSTNTGRLTATTAGNYDIKATIEFAANAVGSRTVLIRYNGTTYIAATGFKADTNAAATTNVAIGTNYFLNATDYAEVVIFQNSGAALNVTRTASYSPEFMVTRIP